MPLQPVPERLQPWTISLRDSQADGPAAAVYKIGSNRLVFIGAEHENENSSLTFQLIRGSYSNFQVNTVVVEGFPNSLGTNNPRLFDYVKKNSEIKDGFVSGGEVVPTVEGAQKIGAGVIGGEASDLDIKAEVLRQGFSPDDLLGFYVLRTIPQWIRERKLKDAGDPRLAPLIHTALEENRTDLSLSANVLSTYEDWAMWYLRTNGTPIGSGFTTEEAAPTADGPFDTNKIAYAVSKARSTFLHKLMVQRLNARESVMVVFGASHLVIQRPALDAALGAPCYLGTDMARAASRCR